MKDFYWKFGVIAKLPFWRFYLYKSHLNGIEDAKKLGVTPKNSNPSFTALLCGTAGEITADEFLKSAFNQNKNAKSDYHRLRKRTN